MIFQAKKGIAPNPMVLPQSNPTPISNLLAQLVPNHQEEENKNNPHNRNILNTPHRIPNLLFHIFK